MTSSTRASLTRPPALAADVRVTEAQLTVTLTDGRKISAPLAEFPLLEAATPAQRANWQITDFRTAIWWPEIDEEIGLAGLLGVSETALEEAAGFTIVNREPSH
jgi:Protein of unknown function (DUF2442)